MADFSASLAAPYVIHNSANSDAILSKKSGVPLALVGSLDTALAALTTGFLQVSSTFQLGNCPGAQIKLIWTYGAAATLLTVRLKASMDNGVLDPYDWVEDFGLAASGVYTPTIFEAVLTKATFDVTTVARMAVPFVDPRRRYFQVWAKSNSATQNSVAGYVGGASNS